MLRLYRTLLHLYPVVHREEFAEEMVAVFTAVHDDAAQRGIFARAVFYRRETTGLIAGALQQHIQALIGLQVWPPFSTRRFTMHTGFRFPKTTAVLMTIILVGILVAIKKAEGIEASLANVTPPMEHLQTNLLPGIAIGLAAFYAAGLLGWSILFAMRRSGVHRLDGLSAGPK